MICDPLTVVLADDHPLVLSGLRGLIGSDPGLRIVAACEDGDVALQAIREHKPVIAVVDLNMPKRDGLNVLATVAAEGHDTRVVLLAAAIGAATSTPPSSAACMAWSSRMRRRIR